MRSAQGPARSYERNRLRDIRAERRADTTALRQMMEKHGLEGSCGSGVPSSETSISFDFIEICDLKESTYGGIIHMFIQLLNNAIKLGMSSSLICLH